MAELNVVKKRNSFWPWLLGAILLVLLLWGISGMLGGEPEVQEAAEQTEP